MPRNSRLVTVIVLVVMAFVSSGCQIVTAPPCPGDQDRGDGSPALSSQGTPLTDADVSSYLACAENSQPSALQTPAGQAEDPVIGWGTVALLLGATILIVTLASM